MKNKEMNYSGIMFILILISYIFNLINIKIFNNTLSIGVIFYSLTYLITFILIKKDKLNNNKKTLLTSIKYFIIFIILITILCQFNSTNVLLNSIRNIFTPNKYTYHNLIIYYPDIYKIIIYLLTYYLSHYIFMIIYDISDENVGYIISFLISILIGFILDQMIFTTIYYLPSIIMNKIEIIEFLKILTGNFIITLLTSFILLIFIPIIKKISFKKS